MARVLITDAEQRSSLAAIRSLGRARHEVYACSTCERPLGGASRYCRSSRHVPDPRHEPDEFVRAISRIVEELGIEVVIPMTDVSAPLVLTLRQTHPHVVIPFPELVDYEAASDKNRLMALAAEIGVPVPRQVVLEKPGALEAESLLDRVGSPLVLKPAHSAVTTGRGRITFGVTIVTQPAALAEALTVYPAEAYPLLVQERIVGAGLGVFMLTWDGRTLAAFAHRRIREKPPTGGVSVYRESVAVAPGLMDYSERLLKRFHWQGVAMVEFKQDARTGKPYLMEINARFWGSLQLAIDAGVDFPEKLIRVALGGTCEPVESFAEGVRSRWLWGDVDHLLWILKTPRAIRAAHPDLPGRVGAICHFLVPWRPGDRFEVLRATDLRPFLRESVRWLKSTLP